MKWLELRIPPPIVGLLVGLTMWFVADIGPVLPIGAAARYGVVAILAVIGVAFDLAGLFVFRASRTTINPLTPQRTSTLVTGGVYRITRNPMYLGLCFLLLAWAVYLSTVVAFVGPIVYVGYITRLQIIPEERVLNDLFGDQYVEYAARVRRWL